MPIHDWTRVPAGLFHPFHQDWSIEIARALNRGRLPSGLSALVEQRAGLREPDVLAIERQGRRRRPKSEGNGGVATVDIPAGTPVEELMKRFGEPLMALTGISGEDYTEKYVFRTPDGARLTVLSIDGKVSTVIVESDPGARAAL